MRVEIKDKVYEFNNYSLEKVISLLGGVRGSIYILNNEGKELAYREFGKWAYC